VASFIEPVFDHYDRSAFEVFCYYSCPKPDVVTQRLRALVDHWRDVPGVPDDVLAARIREDQIDILVDLAGHTRWSRPLVFARKPAPVQVTMIGCMQTTGLKAIDYRITDAELDPPGLTEAYNSEALIRMKCGAVCFKPEPDSPEVRPLPATESGVFTFGSYNNLAKITPDVLDLWSEVLRRVPSSRMLLVADSADYLLNNLELRGISRARIEVLPRMLEREYLESHHVSFQRADGFDERAVDGCAVRDSSWEHLGEPRGEPAAQPAGPWLSCGLHCTGVRGDCCAARA
jgi:predicted O-linked N-acetylglucosamine transferase (SPINDLY family)